MIKVLPPKTAKEVVARERERKARTTLLMAIPEDHLAKFDKMANAKEMWEAIKSRFKGLHKGYDRFQTLLSQLEIHGAGVSHEDANQKFLRSLPSSWSQVALIMRTKPGLDTLSFYDLYNNLRVFECDVKGHFARDYRAKGNQDSRRRDARNNGNKTRDNGRRLAYQDDSKDLVSIDGEDIDLYGSILSYENQVLQSVFMNKETSVNDRYAVGLHAVPPPMIWNYMPFGPYVEIDYSKFTYGPKQTLADASDSKPSEYASCESDSSVETTTSIFEPVENAPKVVCKPKVWTDAPIIKEYESDSDND
nr:xylulose kinase-1 [Tanacetum cinerariifolium]